MISLRSLMAAAGRGKGRLSYRFNFIKNTYVPPPADRLKYEFFPLKPPNFNFTDSTYMPPASNSLTFTFIN